MPLLPIEREEMQTTVKNPYEIDDVALINLLFPPDPTQPPEETTVEHLTEEEAEEIFQREEAAIKPLIRKMRRDAFVKIALEAMCWLVIVFSLTGIVYQLKTFPHTLVILYTKAIPAQVTTTLNLPTRTLAPVTIRRSATTTTTGTGHQDARTATGYLTFYNGSYLSQTINAGTVYAGSSGVQVELLQTVTIPAASPPQFGEEIATAQAVNVGAGGNIAAYDITLVLSNFLTVKNLAAFTGGRDARAFRAVAPKDLQTLTAAVSATLTQAFTNAFSLQPGQAAIPTDCTTKATPNHQAGEEAQSVTLTVSKTCIAVAYNQSELTRAATAAFKQTQPGKQYHVVGSFETTLQSVSPFTVTLTGKWAYTFTSDYEQLLAQGIQGDDPEKARAYLLKTGVISYASVPNTLASGDYINFLVLVG